VDTASIRQLASSPTSPYNPYISTRYKVKPPPPNGLSADVEQPPSNEPGGEAPPPPQATPPGQPSSVGLRGRNNPGPAPGGGGGWQGSAIVDLATRAAAGRGAGWRDVHEFINVRVYSALRVAWARGKAQFRQDHLLPLSL
jgi:hypothetical protein